MSKKQSTELDMPPTWEEMRQGLTPVSPMCEGWTTEELSRRWGKNMKSTLRAIKDSGWQCVGRRPAISITGSHIKVPIYAPKA